MYQISPDPESGSGFQISLDPDLDPVSAKILENCRKVSKSDLSEENLKFMTKDRQKMKKATICLATFPETGIPVFIYLCCGVSCPR